MRPSWITQAAIARTSLMDRVTSVSFASNILFIGVLQGHVAEGR